MDHTEVKTVSRLGCTEINKALYFNEDGSYRSKNTVINKVTVGRREVALYVNNARVAPRHGVMNKRDFSQAGDFPDGSLGDSNPVH